MIWYTASMLTAPQHQHEQSPTHALARLFVAAFVLICASCSPSETNSDSADVVMVHAIEARSIEGIFFASVPEEKISRVLDDLSGLGLLPDADKALATVPALSRYPGWFDFGLAHRSADEGTSFSVSNGTVRVFPIGNNALIVVLPASKQFLPSAPPLMDSNGQTVPAAPPSRWWHLW